MVPNTQFVVGGNLDSLEGKQGMSGAANAATEQKARCLPFQGKILTL